MAKRPAPAATADHWHLGDDAGCTCLTREDHTLKHAARCDVVVLAEGTDWERVNDRDDIRELAEIAAYRDIDTALAIYRAHRTRTGQA